MKQEITYNKLPNGEEIWKNLMKIIERKEQVKIIYKPKEATK